MEKLAFQRLRKVLTAIFICVLSYYIFKYFSFHWEHFVTYNWKFDYLYMLIALVLGAATIVMNASNWQFILKKIFSCQVSLLDATRIFSLSLLGRYIPGKIWMFAGKIYLLSGKDISKVRAGASVMLEFLFFNITSIYIFIFIHVLISDLSGLIKYSFLSIVLTVIFFVPAVLNILDVKIAEIFNRKPIINNACYYDLLIAQNRYFLSWLIQGTGLFFLIKSVYPIGAEYYFAVIAYFSLACTAGVLAFIAPAGLGVREYIMVLFFRNILPQEVIMMTTTLSRLWLTLLEFLIAIIAQTVFSLKALKSMGKNNIKKYAD